MKCWKKYKTFKKKNITDILNSKFMQNMCCCWNKKVSGYRTVRI